MQPGACFLIDYVSVCLAVFYELFDLDLTVCCFLTFRVNHRMRSEVKPFGRTVGMPANQLHSSC